MFWFVYACANVMSVERKFELYRGGALLGVVTLAPDECDFPWLAGYLEPSAEYVEVRALFERESRASEAYESDYEDAAREADEALNEILAPGVRTRDLQSGAWEDVTGISIEGTRVGWR